MAGDHKTGFCTFSSWLTTAPVSEGGPIFAVPEVEKSVKNSFLLMGSLKKSSKKHKNNELISKVFLKVLSSEMD